MRTKVDVSTEMGWKDNKKAAQAVIQVVAAHFVMDPKYAAALIVAAGDTIRKNSTAPIVFK